jgi:hypothetical protein
MTFLSPEDYQIKFSSLDEAVVINKKFLSKEASETLITTADNGLLIEVDGYETKSIQCDYLCRENLVDSGKFTLINTCSMPITVTGFTVSDSERFSLFDHEKYKDLNIYSKEIVEELPFTIEPKKKKTVNTFFHPKYEELQYGNEGTILNRNGDKFGAKVEIYPGFKISNCESNDICDASLTLTGEFLCERSEEGLELLKNKHNFETPGELPETFDPNMDAIPDPSADLFICPILEDEYSYTINFTSQNGDSATAIGEFRVNEQGKWETKIQVSQEFDGESQQTDWQVGHSKAEAGNTSSWIIVPDVENNMSEYPIIFAQGVDGGTTYYSIHEYEDTSTNQENLTTKPDEFLDLVDGNLPETTQPDCVPLG